MITNTFLLIFALFSFQQPKVKSNSTNKLKIHKTVTMKSSSRFVGNYSGKQNQKEIFVTLNAVPNTNKIKGVLVMDGKQAQINTTETNAICTGTITEDDTQKKYHVVLKIIDKKLHFDMVFPEYNNQVLALVLERSTLTFNSGGGNITFDNQSRSTTTSGTNTGTSTKPLNRDRALVGKWRFTEVISSGSGQFYSSLSTDYFIQFDANGNCRSWTGKSAGGSGNVSFDSSNSTNVDEAKWHTIGKTVVFTNSNTNKTMSIPYFAEANRMMLKGNLKRVYQRIE